MSLWHYHALTYADQKQKGIPIYNPIQLQVYTNSISKTDYEIAVLFPISIMFSWNKVRDS